MHTYAWTRNEHVDDETRDIRANELVSMFTRDRPRDFTTMELFGM